MPDLIWFIGIDPGMSGGIAAIVNQVGVAYKMPETEHDVAELLREILPINVERPVKAVIERVGAMPKQGVSSTFKFGRHSPRSSG